MHQQQIHLLDEDAADRPFRRRVMATPAGAILRESDARVNLGAGDWATHAKVPRCRACGALNERCSCTRPSHVDPAERERRLTTLSLQTPYGRKKLAQSTSWIQQEEALHRAQLDDAEQRRRAQIELVHASAERVQYVLQEESYAREDVKQDARSGYHALHRHRQRIHFAVDEDQSRRELRAEERRRRRRLAARVAALTTLTVAELEEAEARWTLQVAEASYRDRLLAYRANIDGLLSSFALDRVHFVDAYLTDRHAYEQHLLADREHFFDWAVASTVDVAAVVSAKRHLEAEEQSLRAAMAYDEASVRGELRGYMMECREQLLDVLRCHDEQQADFFLDEDAGRNAIAAVEDAALDAIWTKKQAHLDHLRDLARTRKHQRARFVEDAFEVIGALMRKEAMVRSDVDAQRAEGVTAFTLRHAQRAEQRDRFVNKIMDRYDALYAAEHAGFTSLVQRCNDGAALIDVRLQDQSEERERLEEAEYRDRMTLFADRCDQLERHAQSMREEEQDVHRWVHRKGQLRSDFAAAEFEHRRDVIAAESDMRRAVTRKFEDVLEAMMKRDLRHDDERQELLAVALKEQEAIDIEEAQAYSDYLTREATGRLRASRQCLFRRLEELNFVEARERMTTESEEQQERFGVRAALSAFLRAQTVEAMIARERGMTQLLEAELDARNVILLDATDAEFALYRTLCADAEAARKATQQREHAELIARQRALQEEERQYFIEDLEGADAEEPRGRSSLAIFTRASADAGVLGGLIDIQRDYVRAELGVDVACLSAEQIAAIAHALDNLSSRDVALSQKIRDAERAVADKAKHIKRLGEQFDQYDEMVRHYQTNHKRRHDEFTAQFEANTSTIERDRQELKKKQDHARDLEHGLVAKRNRIADLRISIDDISRGQAAAMRQSRAVAAPPAAATRPVGAAPAPMKRPTASPGVAMMRR
jgi:hypothetical protein